MWPQRAALTRHVESMKPRCGDGGETGALVHGQRAGPPHSGPGSELTQARNTWHRLVRGQRHSPGGAASVAVGAGKPSVIGREKPGSRPAALAGGEMLTGGWTGPGRGRGEDARDERRSGKRQHHGPVSGGRPPLVPPPPCQPKGRDWSEASLLRRGSQAGWAPYLLA